MPTPRVPPWLCCCLYVCGLRGYVYECLCSRAEAPWNKVLGAAPKHAVDQFGRRRQPDQIQVINNGLNRAGGRSKLEGLHSKMAARGQCLPRRLVVGDEGPEAEARPGRPATTAAPPLLTCSDDAPEPPRFSCQLPALRHSPIQELLNSSSKPSTQYRGTACGGVRLRVVWSRRRQRRRLAAAPIPAAAASSFRAGRSTAAGGTRTGGG